MNILELESVYEPDLSSKKVAVLGAGSWGTALANLLANKGYQTFLWGLDSSTLQAISRDGRNPRYFSELPVSKAIHTTLSLEEAVSGASLVALVVPTKAVREVVAKALPFMKPGVSLTNCAKGLEEHTLLPLSKVIAQVLKSEQFEISVLSGPSFAREVLLGLPTAVTLAAGSLGQAGRAAEFFHTENFRVYTSEDLIGVEYGGALKNVIALASGIIDGLGFGANSRAALITRGLVEMQRIIEACGGRPATIMGLSGLGDLLLTATGDLSRNRRVGLGLGQGKSVSQIVEEIGQVAEGVNTAPVAAELARDLGLDTPIIFEVEAVVSGKSSPEASVRRLLSRAPKVES